MARKQKKTQRRNVEVFGILADYRAMREADAELRAQWGNVQGIGMLGTTREIMDWVYRRLGGRPSVNQVTVVGQFLFELSAALERDEIVMQALHMTDERYLAQLFQHTHAVIANVKQRLVRFDPGTKQWVYLPTLLAACTKSGRGEKDRRQHCAEVLMRCTGGLREHAARTNHKADPLSELIDAVQKGMRFEARADGSVVQIRRSA